MAMGIYNTKNKLNTMKKLIDYKLNSNPFRSVPASVRSSELVWAGFPKVKEKFEDIIKNSINHNPSRLVLNWGEYGSGKTHATRYFNKLEVLKSLKGDSQLPLFIPIDFPQSKQPVWDIVKSVIDKIDLTNIRESAKEILTISDIIHDITDNRFVQSVILAIFNEEVDLQVLKLFMYKFLSPSEIKKKLLKYDIERPISSDNDLVDIISALFSVITFNKKIYSCVIIWFDEFEDITAMTNNNLININSSLRQMFEKSQNNLLMILNITQSSFMDQDDLSEYLSPAIASRITNNVEIKLPSKADIKLYLTELLNKEVFRSGSHDDYFPFKDDVVDKIIDRLNNPSIRKINEVFSLLIEIALSEDADTIDSEFYEQHSHRVF